MQDNSDLEAKIRIRSSSPANAHVLDCYAGEGVISSLYWVANSDRLVCIENDGNKAAKIECADAVIVGDNRIEAPRIASQFNVIDCDSYGLVIPFLELIKPHCKQGTAVFFTDGTPEKARKVWSAHFQFARQIALLLNNCEYSLSKSGSVFYGKGYF